MSLVFFLLLVVVGNTIFLRGLLDETLAPRFTFISLVLLMLMTLMWTPLRRWNPKSIPLPALVLAGFYLMHLASCLWAANIGEALFETQKIFICAVTFLLTYVLLRKDYQQTLKHFSLAATIYLVVLLVFIGPHLYELFTIGFDRHSVMRVYGFSGNKNMLAGLILLLILWIPVYGQYVSKRLPRVLLLLLLGIYLFILYQLETRSVYLALGFVLTVLMMYGLRNYLKRPLPWINLLPPLVWTLLLGISVFNGLTKIDQHWDIMTPGSTTGTLHQRSVVWDKSMDLFTDQPLLGVGAGNWKVNFPNVGMQGLKGADTNTIFFNRPHNDFIQVLTELGLLGGLMYVGLFAILCIGFFKRLQKSDQHTDLPTWITYGSLLGLMSFALFSFPKERIEFQVLLGILLAIFSYQLKDHLPRIKISTGKFRPVLRWTLVGVLSFNLYLGVVRIGQGQKAFVWEQAYQNDQLALVASSVNYRVHPLKSLTGYGTPIAFFSAMQAWEVQDYQTTIDRLNAAVKANPGHLSSHTNMGAAYVRLGMYDAALQSLQNALQIAPYHADTLYNIALIYFNQGLFDTARDYVLRLPDADPRKRILLEKLSGT